MSSSTAPSNLVYPNFQQDYLLETGASHQGLGAVLSQVQPDGRFHPIAHASRGLTSAETNYRITDVRSSVEYFTLSLLPIRT